MTERHPPTKSDDFLDEDGPGADPGAAYERAVDEGQTQPPEEDEGPDVGEIYRSGS